MAAECTLASGAKERARRRSVAFGALAGTLSTAYARIKELEAVLAAVYSVGKDVSSVIDIDEELVARLGAILPSGSTKEVWGEEPFRTY